ncbi:TonB-dependent receptor [Flavobacteriales bacterium]|nr:TonB-dependent receptor [Flavobacteriales bacterium]
MKTALHTFFLSLCACLMTAPMAVGQSSEGRCVILGKVVDATTNAPLPFASVVLQGQTSGTATDFEGAYRLEGVPAGVHNVVVSFLGYTNETVYEIETTPARPAVVNVALSEAAIAVDAAEVVAESRATVEEAPLSVRSIGTNEIKRNPGGGRDISRALRSLPGVAAIPSFRNDIVIRGGAPNENRFYLDGIEIPNINHFATQGASGGPVGMINVDLVEEVDFYAGAFPTARGNALSSVMEFRFKDPRSDQWTANAVLGTSDLGVTVEGPTGENSSLIASFRRSYLQLLFEVIGLPFLPIYNDYQYKWTWRPDDRNAVTVLGLGALDDFELNLDLASDTEAPDYLNQVAILDVLPISEQWNYMQGVKWDRYMDDGKWTFVLSRNMLNNSAFKHVDNDVDLPKSLDYVSQEIENKFRAERFRSLAGGWKLSGGVSAEYAKYNNSTRNTVFVPEVGSVDMTFGSDFKMAKYGAFAQASRPLLENRLTLSAGMRVDGALLLGASEGLALPEGEPLANPLDQFSPRVSASWSFAPGWTWNANAGIYHQLPAYTILGYAVLDADSSSTLFNWTDGLTFTTNRQLVLGIRREIASRNAAVSVEGFYKGYTGSPASANTGIALANLGADFGVIGNERVTFDAEGRAYGMEVLLQQRLYNGYYGLMAYTLVRSEYQNPGDDFALQSWVPSSWDNRHIVSFTGGKKWDSGWEVGARVLFSGGLPYTPTALEQSLLIQNWETFNAPIPDYAMLNAKRNGAFHQVDFRIDRKWFFDNWSLDVFADIQNLTGAAPPQPDQLDVVRDPATGRPIPSATTPGSYDPRFISTATGAILPGLGMIVEL